MNADQWSGVLTLLNELLEDNHASTDPGVTSTDLTWYRDSVDDLQDPGNFALAVDALQAHANNNDYAIPPGLPGSFAGVLDGQTFASLLNYSASHGHAIPAALVPTAQAIQTALGGLAQGPLAPAPDAAMAAHHSKPMALVPSVAPPAVAPALATIRDVQHALNLLGASPPLKEDGVNGPKTIAALKAFQTAHPPLAVDGVAGPQTKSALQHALAASGGQVQRPPVSPGAQIAPQVPGLARILAVAPPPTAPTLTTLKDVQHALNVLGATPPLVEDGVNGPKTIAAVQTFQAAHPPLVVDGVAGTQTRAALQQALAMPALVAAKPLAVASRATPQAPPTGVPVVTSTPAPVTISTLKDVQHALNLLGAGPPLVEDGINGPKTMAAVKAFQAAHPPLAVDGAAGPQTKAALQSAVASATFAAAGGASSWRIATNADVIRDGVAGRFAELLSQPVGSRTDSETHNGRTWCFEVISHRTHPHLTTHAKDVVAYLGPPRLAA
jgi:peptidoglycan hydrolase-like protein with peptidoglycan-binding domain